MTDHESFFNQLKKAVDTDHQRMEGAAAPPANMWKSIRAQANPHRNKEEPTMTVSTAEPRCFAPAISPAHRDRGKVRHTLSLAASFLLVMTVALGGWLATMQLNQPSEPEPRLAILGSTPAAEATPETQGGTCDIEPLETETVMEIVKNPSRFMANGPTGVPADSPMVGSPPDKELWEVDPDLEIVGEKTTPAEVDFNEASEVADRYLACLVSGTQGQIWTFYSPVLLQQKILGEFPVFAEESLVRERVKELSIQPAYLAEVIWDRPSVREGSTVSVNPDHQLAVQQGSESAYYEYILSIGVSIVDVEGNQTVLTNGVGTNLIPQEFGSSGYPYINIAKMRQSDGWLIIPWPSLNEVGW